MVINNKKKGRIELILSLIGLFLSGFIGFLIWSRWGIIAGIAGAVISFIIIALILTKIPKAVFHIALYENENNKVEIDEVKDENNEKREVKKKSIVKPNIEKLREKQDIDGLINALGYKKDSPEEEVELIHELAATTLGEMGAKEAVNPLIQTLHDKAWGVQYAAIEALGNIGDSRAIEPITQCVIETDIERIRGKGMNVLNEVFNLSNTELKEIFLATKADDKAKKLAFDIITEDKDTEKEEDIMEQYWAYINQYGKVVVKYWYEGNKYIDQASYSPYVKKFLEEPFEAESTVEAEEIATKLLNSNDD